MYYRQAIIGLSISSILLITLPNANAFGMDDRIDNRQTRRSDTAENISTGAEDRQDFRQQRNDCLGDGPECRSENRQDKRQDRTDRRVDRGDDRRDRIEQKY